MVSSERGAIDNFRVSEFCAQNSRTSVLCETNISVMWLVRKVILRLQSRTFL